MKSSKTRLIGAVATLALSSTIFAISPAAVGAQAGEVCNGLAITHFVQPGVPFVGTSADEVIFGTDGADVIRGRGGNDTICGAGGADVIEGNFGNDWINGGGGADEIRGGAGHDTIQGGDGNDTAFGGLGRDNMDGGAGDDLSLIHI